MIDRKKLSDDEYNNSLASARLRNATQEEIRGITHSINGGRFKDGMTFDWMMGFMEGKRILNDEQ